MTQEIRVPRTGRAGEPSVIVIGDALGRLPELLAGRRPVIITDRHIAEAYPELVGQHPQIIIGLGETHKTLQSVEDIYRQLLRLHVDRGSYLVGIGGGIVTDITGFVASTYMRGVSGFGFVATSLLAQVDASVGGKNGVNLDGYKNIVGTFNQPDFVLCDQAMLGSLPERELCAGLAEVIKCGLIGDAALFGLFENHSFASFTGDQERLHRAIVASVQLKANVVTADEQEHGERKLLNLGHTFAHAVEKTTGRYLHGEAVGIGLCVAARLSHKLGLLTGRDLDRVIAVVGSMGLPTSVEQGTGGAAAELLTAMAADKKCEDAEIDYVLMDGIGQAGIRRMPIPEMQALMRDLL